METGARLRPHPLYRTYNSLIYMLVAKQQSPSSAHQWDGTRRQEQPEDSVLSGLKCVSWLLRLN
ncbi:hypothetical protein SBA5_80004 [Candidatus Sulfotelmatomonas gaucii]|uniref:Uncharacterized protein n=1 Tax=Candidatus Sulfuritelmatomonas gaucii TaxID=2043161 RepID=A0A2N9M539_9BACT|nr:hypothetical protein SBA5_80004 [Candidatus Sulfotelmatomonas gaucii]